MCNCKTKCKCSSETTLDPSKPIQCLSGNKARIIATDVESPKDSCKFNIIALVETAYGEYPYLYSKDGVLNGTYKFHSSFNLVNIPNRREEYRNFFLSSTFPLSSARSLKSARSYGAEILKFSYEDDKLISVEIMK